MSSPKQPRPSADRHTGDSGTASLPLTVASSARSSKPPTASSGNDNLTPIAAIDASVGRPLWSVVVPTFNCARYLTTALQSVLVQAPEARQMEVEVVDDCSTSDDPAAIVEALYSDRVSFYRQPRNVGHIANFATGIQRARGHLIHLLHGDDNVRPGFYQKLEQAFAQRPEVGAAFCRQIFMDSDGHWQALSPIEMRHPGILDDALVRLALEQRIMTPSIVVRRDVYESLGGFDRRLKCSEDWEMWVRIAANYPIWYEPEPLAVYRMHDQSNTGRHTRSAEDLSYTVQAIDIFSAYLPPDRAAEISGRAKATYALAALETARRFGSHGDYSGFRAQLLAALRCSRRLDVVLAASRLLGAAVLDYLRPPWRQVRENDG